MRELKRVHMIGNAHIDPVWLWQWPEGYQEVRATFHSALDRMDEYPEFVFTCTSVAFLDWVDEHDPELFERMRERIEDGRWQVIGGWWIEPDCNIPSGESLVRQGLYGQRWLRDRLGITATTGANLDSFGHNATIPQLLAKSGMDSYVFLRPQRHEKELPGPTFRWVSSLLVTGRPKMRLAISQYTSRSAANWASKVPSLATQAVPRNSIALKSATARTLPTEGTIVRRTRPDKASSTVALGMWATACSSSSYVNRLSS